MRTKERCYVALRLRPITMLTTLLILSIILPVTALGYYMQLPDGSKLDLSQKCPVCGMLVGGKEGEGGTVTYKDGRITGFHGAAAAVFKDGRVVGFEGARCLFIYNSVPQKYNVNVEDIAHQYVTDFVTKKMIELPKAFLVLGSEVKGPMGYELIAFETMEAAAKFASENDGKWIVQLHEIARVARKQSEDTEGIKEKRKAVTEQDKLLTPSSKTEATQPDQPQEQGIQKSQKRFQLQRKQELDPYEPFMSFGHHGGHGHHSH